MVERAPLPTPVWEGSRARAGSFCDRLLGVMGDEQNRFASPNGEAKIGPVLADARKERGLTLDDVEQATKIRKRYLAGLENENYSVLPDAVYTQGFLKTYANYLGLDGEELSRQLKNRRKPRRERSINYSPPKQSDFSQPLISPGGLDGTRRRNVSGATVLTVVVAILALAAVIGALYYVGRGVQTSDENPQASPQSAGNADSNSGQNDPQAEASKTASRPDSDAANEGESRATDGQSGGDEAVAGESEAPPDTLRVVVTVEVRPSWLSIQTDGVLAYEDIGQPGFSQTFEAKRRLSITTGDAGAVTVEVNGQDVGVLGGPGEVLTRDFTLKDEI
jgi:cytoskeleton protein RodZ